VAGVEGWVIDGMTIDRRKTEVLGEKSILKNLQLKLGYMFCFSMTG
jgi:hypothetical protein